MHKKAITLLMTLAALIGLWRRSIYYMGRGKANTGKLFRFRLFGPNPKSLPHHTMLVYIALRSGKVGSGASTADALNGSTVAAFDTILRCSTQGARTLRSLKVSGEEQNWTSFYAGTCSTLAAYDYLINIPHKYPAGLCYWQRMEDPWRGKR